MRLVYTARAYRTLDAIWLYIAEDSRRAADQVVARIRQSIEILADFPGLYPAYDGGPVRVLTVSGLSGSTTGCSSRPTPWKSC